MEEEGGTVPSSSSLDGRRLIFRGSGIYLPQEIYREGGMDEGREGGSEDRRVEFVKIHKIPAPAE